MKVVRGEGVSPMDTGDVMSEKEENVKREKLEGGEVEEQNPSEHDLLLELARYRMPFGKYKGCKLVDLPEPYVVWFSQRGFPEGKLGNLLRIVYEIKVNGLEYLFKPLS